MGYFHSITAGIWRATFAINFKFVLAAAGRRYGTRNKTWSEKQMSTCREVEKCTSSCGRAKMMAAWSRENTQTHAYTKQSDLGALLCIVGYRNESNLTQRLTPMGLRTCCILGELPMVCSKDKSSLKLNSVIKTFSWYSNWVVKDTWALS